MVANLTDYHCLLKRQLVNHIVMKKSMILIIILGKNSCFLLQNAFFRLKPLFYKDCFRAQFKDVFAYPVAKAWRYALGIALVLQYLWILLCPI